MVRLIGWFNPLVGEVHEMLYQNDSPYLIDSSKFERAFRLSRTHYAEGNSHHSCLFPEVALSAK